jgi:hypothetical protein
VFKDFLSLTKGKSEVWGKTSQGYEAVVCNVSVDYDHTLQSSKKLEGRFLNFSPQRNNKCLKNTIFPDLNLTQCTYISEHYIVWGVGQWQKTGISP